MEKSTVDIVPSEQLYSSPRVSTNTSMFGYILLIKKFCLVSVIECFFFWLCLQVDGFGFGKFNFLIS